MKKAYVKPEIELESFQFSANVANECGYIVDNLWKDELTVLSENTCELDELFMCYHNPGEGQTVFGS